MQHSSFVQRKKRDTAAPQRALQMTIAPQPLHSGLHIQFAYNHSVSSLGRFPCTFAVDAPTGRITVVSVWIILFFVILVTVGPPTVHVVPGVGVNDPCLPAVSIFVPILAMPVSAVVVVTSACLRL